MSDVIPQIYYGSLCLTDYPYAIGREDDGLKLGSPEKVMEVIETLLANGDVTLSSGEGNRTLSVPVYIMGGTLKEVAEAEAALQLECDKDYNEFTLIPGGLGAATVFDTYAADSPHDRDDRFEADLLRLWNLSIPAAPRPRSAESVTEVAVYDASPSSDFQHAFSLDVAGSSETEGSLHVSHASSDLGDVAVYTCRNDVPTYLPNLRQYASTATAAAATADAAIVSGARNNLDGGWTAEVPASTLPRGSYVLWARLRSNVAGDQVINWNTGSYLGASTIRATASFGSTTVNFAATNTWYLMPLVRLQLPPMLLPAGSTAKVNIDLVAANPAASNIDIDEAWAFNVTIGALTVIDKVKLAGGTPPDTRNVWIDTPSVDLPKPSVWRGLAGDRSNSYGAGGYVNAWGRHELKPPTIRGFLVTTGAADAVLSMDHYPRWPNYAGD